jgi:peroxiredoxin/HEAT repeat protein
VWSSRSSPPPAARNSTQRPNTEASTPPPSPSNLDAAPSRQEVIKSVRDAIVQVTIRNDLGEDRGLGSGVIIDAKGLVATNYHVVEDAANAYVVFHDGKQLEVEGMRAADPDSDLAILQLKDPPAGLRALPPQPIERTLEQGEEVIAIGHPGGFQFTVTTGVISAVRRTRELPGEFREFIKAPDDTTWIQTNAAISGGNSGGPLLDARGNLLGINTWIVPGRDLNFAVHVRHLVALQARMKEQLAELPGKDKVDRYAQQLEPEVQRVLEEFEQAAVAFVDRLKSSKTVGQAKAVLDAQNPTSEYARKLLNLALRAKGTRKALHALTAVFLVCRDNTATSEASIARAGEQLLQNHADSDELYIPALVLGVAGSAEAQKILQRIIDTTPHDTVKGAAMYSLAMALHSDKENRRQNEPQIVKLLDAVIANHADVNVFNVNLGDRAATTLFEVEYLTIGKTAPEITGQDLDGKSMRLSDFRGQVVLLDFWVDWCPFCREMYPHERNLLEEYSGKPFTILGVNCDDPKKARQVQSSGKVTWRSWADGPNGPINDQWNVKSFPTVVLLDAEGRIRFKNVRGPALDAAIRQLVREAGGFLQIPDDLVEHGAQWKYYDATDRPHSSWYKPDFDDSSWESGEGPLGYGLSEQTRIGPGVGRPFATTTYFRCTFQYSTGAAPAEPILNLSYTGGVKLYLNGKQVLRRNLSRTASSDDFAVDPSRGTETLTQIIDPGLFQPGANVVAVEVHRSNNRSRELGMDATLGTSGLRRIVGQTSNTDPSIRGEALLTLGALGNSAERELPSIVKALDDADPEVRIAAARALGEIGYFHEKIFAGLKAKLADDDDRVRAWALLAALQIDERQTEQILGDGKLPQPRDALETEARQRAAAKLHASTWIIARHAGLEPADYSSALRAAEAITKIVPNNGAYLTTLGVAQYRSRKYSEAQSSLKKALNKNAVNPIDLSFLAMAQHRCRDRNESRRNLLHAAKLLESGSWLRDAAAVFAYNEAVTTVAR